MNAKPSEPILGRMRHRCPQLTSLPFQLPLIECPPVRHPYRLPRAAFKNNYLKYFWGADHEVFSVLSACMLRTCRLTADVSFVREDEQFEEVFPSRTKHILRHRSCPIWHMFASFDPHFPEASLHLSNLAEISSSPWYSSDLTALPA